MKGGKRIDVACRTGDVELLYQSLINGEEIPEIDLVHTPLLEAAKMGHTQFCAEMMNLMTSFGKKLNPDGLSPLHLALQHRQKTTALALLDIDKELVRVKGKDGMTPLMSCAKSFSSTGDHIYLEILAKFLRECPQSIYDKNIRSQTALHVALENNNSDDAAAAVILLNWIERTKNENVLRIKDDKGNRPLHLAAQHNCIEAMKIMVKIALLNKRNYNNETPLDIAITFKHPEIIKLLKEKKALRSDQMLRKSTYTDFLRVPASRFEKAMKTYNYMMKDLNTEMRNMVLVVAVLIATATYTTLLQPPGGVYQTSATADADDDKNMNSKYSTIGRGSLQIAVPPVLPPSSPPDDHIAGRMLMKDGQYKRFVPSNAAAFTLSIMVIIFVLPIILHACLIFLSYSCLIGLVFVSDDSEISYGIFFLGWCLIPFTFVMKLVGFLFVN